MPDFSTIIQEPKIRSLVQDHVLERQFHDGLYPRNLFRGEAAPRLFPGNVGDSMTFTGVGMMKPSLKPLRPGTDPVAGDYDAEQWSVQLQLWSGRCPDTIMPTSIAAIASLFMRNVQQLGLQAAQTLNRLVRDKLYNAGMSGWTVSNGACVATTSLKVKRLNGFHRAPARPGRRLARELRYRVGDEPAADSVRPQRHDLLGQRDRVHPRHRWRRHGPRHADHGRERHHVGSRSDLGSGLFVHPALWWRQQR